MGMTMFASDSIVLFRYFYLCHYMYMEASSRCEKVASCYQLSSQWDICTFKFILQVRVTNNAFSGYLLFANMIHIPILCSLHIITISLLY